MIDRRQWIRAVDASPALSSSAKRYAGWLIKRPVKNTPDEYKGGQEVAAKALHLAERTIRNAEKSLLTTGWLTRQTRGTKNHAYSTFRLVDATVNRQELPVETAFQPALGGRLKLVSQPAKVASSMTKPPIRVLGTTAFTRRHNDATAPGRATRRAARSSSLHPSSGTERVAGFKRHSTTAGRSRPSHPLAGAIA